MIDWPINERVIFRPQRLIRQLTDRHVTAGFIRDLQDLESSSSVSIPQFSRGASKLSTLMIRNMSQNNVILMVVYPHSSINLFH